MSDRERARKLAARLFPLPDADNEFNVAMIETVLASVRAETVEEATKIADEEAQEAQQAIDRGDYDTDDIPMGQHGASARIAAAIRSLKTGDTNV